MISFILVLFFGATSALHFYWAIGGRWGFEAVLPRHESGEFVILPTMRDCVSVALLLQICALLYTTKIGLRLPVPDAWLTVGFYLIPIGLTLRGVGDFRYVGLSKRIKDTEFARRDSRYFTPLCLLMAGLGLINL